MIYQSWIWKLCGSSQSIVLLLRVIYHSWRNHQTWVMLRNWSQKWTHKWQDLNPGSPSEKPPLCHMSQSFFLFFIHSFFWFVSFLYILSFCPKILIYYSFLCTSFWCINFVCDNGSVFIVFILNLTLILERKNGHLRILPDQIYSASV